jgi:hypothetical protein
VTLYKAFAPGRGGPANLTDVRDRHGGLRARCANGKEPAAGTFVLGANDWASPGVSWCVEDPQDGDAAKIEKAKVVTEIDWRIRRDCLARVMQHGALSTNKIAEVVSGGSRAIEEALIWLAENGQIIREKNGNAATSAWIHRPVRTAELSMSEEQLRKEILEIEGELVPKQRRKREDVPIPPESNGPSEIKGSDGQSRLT